MDQSVTVSGSDSGNRVSAHNRSGQPHPAPSMGRVVHYVSHGTPVREDGSQAYTSQCRAAIVTGVPGGGVATDTGDCVSLVVFNPSGSFFDQHVCQDEADKLGGTWHWPERV